MIEWAGVQPWSNGNVGLSGVSYFAMSQWYVAALNPPHLKAIMPAEGLTDMYRDVMRHGDIPAVFAEAWMEHRVRRVENPVAMLVRDPAVGALEHPLDGAYWQAWVPELTNISVPAYVIASWPDHGLHTRGTLIGFERISSEHKWLEVHERKKWEYYNSRESLERQRRFFDCFLKGIENGMDRVPPVRYERRNRFYDGDFLFAENWPLPNTEALELYLQPEGGLALDPSATEETLRYDSEFGQLAFQYEFEEDTEITGGAWLRLWVEADAADDMDLFVGLGKLDRYGSEVLMPGYSDVENGHLASGWLRVSHREIDEGRSTEFRPYLRHEQEQKLSPGEIVPVDIEILPSSTYFEAGQSLVLRVQGVELEGAGDIEHKDPVNTGDHIVHVGGAYGSSLLLPVVQ